MTPTLLFIACSWLSSDRIEPTYRTPAKVCSSVFSSDPPRWACPPWMLPDCVVGAETPRPASRPSTFPPPESPAWSAGASDLKRSRPLGSALWVSSGKTQSISVSRQYSALTVLPERLAVLASAWVIRAFCSHRLTENGLLENPTSRHVKGIFSLLPISWT